MDGRKINHKDLENIRLLAIKEYSDGVKPKSIAHRFGLSRSCIYRWIKNYKTDGAKSLMAKPLFGRPSLLEREQLQHIYRILSLSQNEHPELWNQKLLRAKIFKMYSVNISKPTLSRILNQMGIASQKNHYRFNPGAKYFVKNTISEKLKAIYNSYPGQKFEIIYLDHYQNSSGEFSQADFIFSFLTSKGGESFWIGTINSNVRILARLIEKLSTLQPLPIILVLIISERHCFFQLINHLKIPKNRIQIIPLIANSPEFNKPLLRPVI